MQTQFQSLSFLANPGPPDFRPFLAPDADDTIDALLQHARTTQHALEQASAPPSWDTLPHPILQLRVQLDLAHYMLEMLAKVRASSAQQRTLDRHVPRINRALTALMHSPVLLAKMQTFTGAPDYARHSAQQRERVVALINDMLGYQQPSDFTAELEALDSAITDAQSALHKRLEAFDCAMSPLYLPTDCDLAGLDEEMTEQMRLSALQDGYTGYKLTLKHWPSILRYAHDASLRQTVHQQQEAYHCALGQQLAEDFASLLMLYRQSATTQGYASHADASMVANMLNTPAQATAFLDAVEVQLQPTIDAQKQTIVKLGRELGLAPLVLSDRNYLWKRLRDAQHFVRDEETCRYFPESAVLGGIIELVHGLFDIDMSLDPTPGWHEEVKCLRLMRGPRLVGYLYLDLYARPYKSTLGYGLAVPLRAWGGDDDAPICPVAAILCDFRRGAAETGLRHVHCLSYHNVGTLFHELGHALHHLLANVDGGPGLAFQRIESDTVEMPAFFLQSFTWEYEVVAKISADVDTGQAMPRAMFERIIQGYAFDQAGVLAAGLATSGAMLAAFGEHPPGASSWTDKREAQGAQETKEPPQAPELYELLSNVLIGLGPSYYAYLWGPALASELFAPFRQRAERGESVISRELGQRYHQEILLGSVKRPMYQSLAAFQGPEARATALRAYRG